MHGGADLNIRSKSTTATVAESDVLDSIRWFKSLLPLAYAAEFASCQAIPVSLVGVDDADFIALFKKQQKAAEILFDVS